MEAAAAPSAADYECALCLRLLYAPCTLRCGHSFCLRCCSALYDARQSKCPTCRRVLPLHGSAADMASSLTLSRLLEATFPAEYEARRKEDAAEGGAPALNSLVRGAIKGSAMGCLPEIQAAVCGEPAAFFKTLGLPIRTSGLPACMAPGATLVDEPADLPATLFGDEDGRIQVRSLAKYHVQTVDLLKWKCYITLLLLI